MDVAGLPVTRETPEGIYERLITPALRAELELIGDDLIATRALRSPDAADRIASHVATEIARAIASIPEPDRADRAAEIATELLTTLDRAVARVGVLSAVPSKPAMVLHAVGQRRPDGGVDQPAGPMVPLLDTTLLANAAGEPTIGSQVLSEIASADAIDLVMAFIRRSGITPLKQALAQHCRDGRSLRILTTVYTGSTERRALDELRDLGADIRVSYDVTTTRLHAKAWLFQRHSGFSTAYVGSSNLTHSAQVTGQEWNVRVSQARNPDVVERLKSVFDTYWESDHFQPYDEVQFDEAIARSAGSITPTTIISPIAVRPEPFQERLLEQISAARVAGHHRNLLVAATGTGKTVMAALDYDRLRPELPRDRLLFVAHREEILDQSIATYRQVLRQADFGEKWVSGHRPARFDHVFASIQSLRNADLMALARDHFDVVVVDEFHHAAAPSYQRLLEHVEPAELLGLTATPERMDGLDVRAYFGGRIAAELRVWDAIDQGYLSPFVYFGVYDGTDLSRVPWRRGQGYDVEALTNVYTGDDAWARTVWNQVLEYVDDPASMKALGFCVSVAHAQFMAAKFVAFGVDAVAVWGESADDVRRDALDGLRAGRIQIVFSVDLFNEGVDVPAVDVVLMLRPTESATLFLQQLGRGLRKAVGKAACTVLDFVGMHRKEFRFDQRYRALLGGSRADVERAVEQGFPFLPSGCVMQLDKVASEIVLRSIRDAVPSRWTAKVSELRDLVATDGSASLSRYLDETRRDLADVYAGNHSWTELRAAAGLPVAADGPREVALRRAIGRLLHVDDRERLATYRALLSQPTPDVASLSAQEQRLARMLAVSLAGQTLGASDSVQHAVDVVWSHPNVLAELDEVFALLDDDIDHLHRQLPSDAIPLQVHAQYSRVEILAALGEGDVALTPQWREGVLDAKVEGADVLAFTLDKTSGEFSPTTRYRDYAISRELIHWESQSTTRADSPTGLRYQNHVAMGRSILLFARLRQDDRAYWFLGPATYVSHEGERPMAITWRLESPLPGDLYASFAAAVA